MTFIASIIAKEGIAIVADSFGTTMEHSIKENKFLDHMKEAENKENIAVIDLVGLFEKRPSHTINYIDKLFKFDKYSAVTFTGAVYINGKEIKEIIKKISTELQVDTATYNEKDISDILIEFCEKLKSEVIQHCQTNDFPYTDFIFSHFNVSKNESQIFLIKIKGIEMNCFDPNDPNLIEVSNQSHLGIVTDGQNNFVERLIFGSLVSTVDTVKSVLIKDVIAILGLKDEQIEKLTNHINSFECLKQTVLDDMFSINFRQLSLQEALDLAALLIKIVMDIQIYTEKIPTVGGLIRLAVIHEERGFEWISGNNLIPSNII